jgi:hypothetical protein
MSEIVERYLGDAPPDDSVESVSDPGGHFGLRQDGISSYVLRGGKT